MEGLYDKLRFSIVDGMQALTISTKESDNIDLNTLEKYLLSMSIINYDIEQIDKVIHNATDKPEIIGPVFEKFNITKKRCITIKNNGLNAFVTLSGEERILEQITLLDLVYILKKDDILNEFIHHQVIEKALESKVYNKDILVAKAIKPENGENAKIDYKIDVENIGTPRELEDGRADYKNIGKVLIVTAKQVIAEKIPATLGTDGTNLSGEAIPAVPGEDITLPAGKNTSLSDDGMKLFANVDGYVYKSELGVNIGETFMVEGDLDFNTGNIDYNGDIFIKKNVLPDFEVISQNGNIYIEGEVDNAHIEALNGEVHVKKGVFGDNSTIKGKKVCLDFIQGEAKIAAEEIEIKKFSYGAKLLATEVIKVNSIMGGEAVSQKEVYANEVGSESNTETVLKIYNDRVDEISELLDRAEADNTKLEKSFTEVSNQIQHIKRTIAIKKNNITPEEKKKAAAKIAEYNKIKDFMGKLEQHMQTLRDERFNILSAAGAKINIKAKLYPNVKITIFSNKYVSKELYLGEKTIDINTLKL